MLHKSGRTIFILLIFFAAESFFWMFNFLDWRITYILLCFLFFLLLRTSYNLKSTGFRPFIQCYLLLWLVSAIYTFTHDAAPIQTEVRSYMMALPMLLLFRPFASMGHRYGVSSLMTPMVFFSRIVVIVLLLQYAGLINLIAEDTLSERDGMRSFMGANAMTLGLFFELHRVLFRKDKDRIFSWAWILLTLTCIILVNQSRSTIFAVLGGVVILFYYRWGKLMKRAGCIGAAIKITLVALVVYYTYNYVMGIINESISMKEASSIQRIDAYAYYWMVFLQHPLVGVGFSSPNNLISEGTFLNLFTDDIGIVGYLAQSGLLGILMQTMIVINYVKCIKRLNNDWKYLFLTIGFFYILISPFNSYMLTHQEYVIYTLALLSVVVSYYGTNTKLVQHG